MSLTTLVLYVLVKILRLLCKTSELCEVVTHCKVSSADIPNLGRFTDHTFNMCQGFHRVRCWFELLNFRLSDKEIDL